MRLLLFFFLLLSTANMAFAQKSEAEALFEKGLAAYQKEEYDNAIQFFERAQTGKFKSPECFTNLGLAYHKSGDLGRAILSFERALRINPDYSIAKQNLLAARQLISSDIKPVKSFWLFGALSSLCFLLSSKYWAIMFWIFLYAAVLVFTLKNMIKSSWLQKKGNLSSVVLIVGALIFFVVGNTVYASEYNPKAGIIINSNTGIRTAPGLDGEDITVIGSGVKAIVLEQSADWLKLRLENGIQGWIPARFFELI